MTERTKPMKAVRVDKRCPCCKQTKPLAEFYREYSAIDGRSVYCAECIRMKSKSRNWKRYMANKRATEPDRQQARERLQDAVRRGQIKRKDCLFCTESKTEAHHLLYEFWSIVVWLCSRHHKAVHQQAKFQIITPIKNPTKR